MIWPITAKIYWDPVENVPLIKPSPEKEDMVYRLKLTEPGDARPAFKRDYEKLREGIYYEFRSERIYKEFFEGKFLLLNKVPHWDQMWEVVVDGNVLGQLYYDPFRDTWRFRLNYTGALIAVQQDLVDYIVVDGFIREKKILKDNYSSSSGQIVLLDKKGDVKGLAENVEGVVVVTKVFRTRIPPQETSMKKTTLDDVLKHNDYGLYYFESRAKAFIYSMASKVGKEVVVSYSGGKDSLTALHLTLDTLGNATLLFNNTGLELPETIENVEYVASKYGLKIVVADAGDAFWRAVEVFGPPGKDYRWCCKVVKLVPLARLAKRTWPQGALNIVGQRAFESLDRARSPRVWRNRWIPHLLSITPIQEWSQLHIWLYIFKHKLPYNKLYDLGYERLGCYVCPSSTLAEFKEVERNHPELWRKWLEVLERWRKKLGQPIEWIKYGLWRWLTPAAAKKRLAVKIKGYSIDWREEYRKRLLHGIGLAPINIEKNNNVYRIVFSKEVVPATAQYEFSSNIKMLKFNIYRDSGSYIIESSRARITISGNTLFSEHYEEKGFEDLADVLKIIYRIHGCVKCGSCVLWCPLQIIRLTSNGPLPTRPCPACRICLEVCPISELLVEKVVLPLITDNVEAWRRRTRTKREELIRSFKSMGIIPMP